MVTSSTDVVTRGGKHDDFKYYYDDKDDKKKYDVSPALFSPFSIPTLVLTGVASPSLRPLSSTT